MAPPPEAGRASVIGRDTPSALLAGSAGAGPAPSRSHHVWSPPGSRSPVTQDGAAARPAWAESGETPDLLRVSRPPPASGKDRGCGDSRWWLIDLSPGPYLRFVVLFTCQAER